MPTNPNSIMNRFNIEPLFSRAANTMKKSAIREILKLTQKPEMISFAGGLPAPETFPVNELKEIVLEVLEKDGAASLQYGTTEGDARLRQLLVDRHNRDGLNLTIDNLIINTGSQQALDLLAKILIDSGDYVICGLPSYLGGLNAFSVYGAKLKGIPFDDYGMMPSELEKAIVGIRDLGRVVKFIYIIPDFQNPAGITAPESRRLEILAIAEKYDLLIVEDSPYREVRFSGEPQKLIYQLDTSGRVVTLFTFSKIFAPGFRLAWTIGHPVLLDKLVMAKQSADLCTPVFVQKIAARYIEKGLLEKNLITTIALYKERCYHMIACLKKYMPAGVRWTEPDGGLFLFITLPEHLDSMKIFEAAIEKNVAFVTGSVFYCNDGGRNTMRLNFSYCNKEEIEEGVKRLASVVAQQI
jgi:2-aminoadipate transaminase